MPRRKACILCGKVIKDHDTVDIPFHNLAIKSWVAYMLSDCLLCEECEKRYIAAMKNLCDEVQSSLSDTQSMLRQYMDGTDMGDVIRKHPDGDFNKLFDALLAEGMYLREDFSVLVLKVGWQKAYSKLSAIQLSQILEMNIRDVLEFLLKEIPEDEWRWDIRYCADMGFDKCIARIILGPPNGYYDEAETDAKPVSLSYEQMTLNFDE